MVAVQARGQGGPRLGMLHANPVCGVVKTSDVSCSFYRYNISGLCPGAGDGRVLCQPCSDLQ